MISVKLQNDEFVLVRELLESSLEGLNDALKFYEDAASLNQLKIEREEVDQLLKKFVVELQFHDEQNRVE